MNPENLQNWGQNGHRCKHQKFQILCKHVKQGLQQVSAEGVDRAGLLLISVIFSQQNAIIFSQISATLF